MKLIKKILKIFGLIALPIVFTFGSIIASFNYINGELQTNTIEETKDKFGEFDTNQIFKSVELKGVKASILKTAGLFISNLKSMRNVTISSIAYKSEGLIVTGVMVTPKKQGKYPCIIYNRGGNREYGELTFAQVSKYMSFLAEQGYVVIASNYRGNNGSEGKEEFGGADVNDVMSLIPALSQVAMADTSKIGLLGHSRGGMMVYKALQNKNIFKTAVVIAGATNHFTTTKERPEMEKYVYSEIIPNYKANRTEILKDRSVVFWSEKLSKIPLFILHGSKDKRVNHKESSELVSKLDSLNFPYKFATFKDGNHALQGFRKKSNRLMIEWFNNYLRDNKPFNELSKKITISKNESI